MPGDAAVEIVPAVALAVVVATVEIFVHDELHVLPQSLVCVILTPRALIGIFHLPHQAGIYLQMPLLWAFQ
jgi:hypothetical protein